MARKQGPGNRTKKTSKQMRAVSTRAAQPAEVTNLEPSQDTLDPQPTQSDAPAAQRSAPTRTRPYQHRKASSTARLAPAATVSMSKDQEYAFIREDLRRLLITAGVLVAVMIALLLAIGQ